MTTLAYPSVDFPGPPSVSIDIPDDWQPVHAPGTQLAARLYREGAFSPNVVLNIEPAPASLTVQEALARIVTMAQELGGRASEPYAAQLGGIDFVGCDATWPDEDVETILQCNLFSIVREGSEDSDGSEGSGGGAAGTGDRGRPGHLVQLTGAVGGPSAEEDYDIVRSVLMTTRLTPWAGAGAGA